MANEMEKDYYDILGIARSASKQEIKSAYRILAHHFHPDKDDGDDRKFLEIAEAYRVLSDDESRERYDEKLESAKSRQLNKEVVPSKEIASAEKKSGGVGAVIITVIIAAGLFYWMFQSLTPTQSPYVAATVQSSTAAAAAVTDEKNPSIINTQQQTQSQSTDALQITAADVAPYLTGVVEILCKRADQYGVEQIHDTGSGSLWSFPNGVYDVVTNEHVVAGNDYCILWIPNSNGTQNGTYDLDLSDIKNWNSIADEAVIPILSVSATRARNSSNNVGIDDIPVSQLNYSISSLQNCSSNMPSNSPVTVVGYPAFSSINSQDNWYGAFKSQITTNGVISGSYSLPKNSSLPYSDYYISATIDSGNSGGIAFSKNANGVCLLGIPTWITLTGNYTNEGIVQNIKNVMWVASN